MVSAVLASWAMGMGADKGSPFFCGSWSSWEDRTHILGMLGGHVQGICKDPECEFLPE